MKNWKLKVLSSTLALSLLLPTTAFAADALTSQGNRQNTKQIVHHQKFDQEKRQQMQDQLLDLVNKYTPKDLTEWKSAIAEREKLIIQLREQRPQLSDEEREKLKAIHDDLKNGKITKEQAKEEFKKLGLKDKNKNELQRQFREAVNTNDEAKIKELLPQMLQQMQDKNKALAEKLTNTKK